MKKWILRSGVLVAILALFVVIIRPESLVGKPAIHSNAALLMDYSTGDVILNSNGDVPLPTGSVSKLMAQLIILDELEAGHISWEDPVEISQNASEAKGQQVLLKPGDQFTVRELFEVISVYSANDATIALAEHVLGTEDRFVMRMNEKAKELGLSVHTTYNNVTGNTSLSGGPTENYMTANDVAVLSAHIIRKHPEILKLTSLPQVELKGKGLYMSNTNWMLSGMGGPYSYAGVDGLRTGYTDNAGYCYAGTVHQNGNRFIAIVLGAESQEQRFSEAKELFNYGYSHASYTAAGNWHKKWGMALRQAVERTI
ncbi:D-alanyl-D-alanine carboxypeptidase [Neobacillus mesonae]|nr:D-alanyl-D-alanine carboxypeptidase [Neobacillus mesonae]